MTGAQQEDDLGRLARPCSVASAVFPRGFDQEPLLSLGYPLQQGCASPWQLPQAQLR